MRLWIGLHLPRLPLEVFCPNWSADPCAVVLEQERVLAVSALAQQAGVRAGMRRGGALMLAPQVRLLERAPEREAEALQAVAMALLQFTPQVAAAEEATLLMDVGASLRLFGGVRRLCRLITARLQRLGFSAALSCAPTARGAWLLARAQALDDGAAAQVAVAGQADDADADKDAEAAAGRVRRAAARAALGGAFGAAYGRALGMASMARRLDRLPCALLPPARPYSAWFEGIGCQSLGQMRRLPRPGLQRRCGRALLDMLDGAHGQAPEMFEWIAAPAGFRATLELFDRVENAEALLFGARRLLLQLTGWLCARQLAVARIHLLLEHERGRVARPPTKLELVLAEPTWRDEHLLRLLRERLAQLVLEAPVIGLCLEALQVQPMAPPSESLFPEPGGKPEDRQRLFELLAARLGPDNVLQAAPLADYRPELANRWLPLPANGKAAAGLAQLPPEVLNLPRPGWLLTRPIALLMRDQRPFYGSPLSMVSLPERVEAGWWGDSLARDYFIAEGRDHAFYWVYRERIAGSGEDAEPRWFLHGLFS